MTGLPIIGIVKRDLEGSHVRISPFKQDIADLARLGADIIAYDATDRPRPEASAVLVEKIKQSGKLAMADIFLIALYITLAKGISYATIETAWGLYLFTACILASLALGHITEMTRRSRNPHS